MEYKQQVVRRLSCIEGHVRGVGVMVLDGRSCLDILEQTYAIRQAISKLETMLLEHHIKTYVAKIGRKEPASRLVDELRDIYLKGR